MNRIAYMVLRNFFRAPIWFYHIWKLGRSGDTHTEQQRYDYIRNVVKTVNRTGRVEVEVHGIQNLPEKNGFILFPNHQGLFDVLAIMESCPNPLGIVVKKEASNIILIKQVIAAMHGMAIDRQDVKASLKVITKMTEDVKQGRNYVILDVYKRQVQPFAIWLVTTKKERTIHMEYKPAGVSKAMRIAFPIVVTIIVGMIAQMCIRDRNHP